MEDKQPNVNSKGFPELMGTELAASILGVHVETARRLCRDGVLPAVKIGRHWYVPRGKFEEFLEKQLDAWEVKA